MWASTGVVVLINHLNSCNSLKNFLHVSSSWQTYFNSSEHLHLIIIDVKSWDLHGKIRFSGGKKVTKGPGLQLDANFETKDIRGFCPIYFHQKTEINIYIC